MGHYFSGRIAEALLSRRPTCIIVGSSSARDAFDAAVLEHELPAYHFINAAASGGSIFRIELSMRLLESYHVTPTCLIVGFQSHLLRDNQQALEATGYLDVMPAALQPAQIRHEEPVDRAYTMTKAAEKIAWPPLRMDRQVSRLVRVTLSRANAAGWGVRRLDRRAFEFYPGDLAPLGEHDAGLTRWPDADIRASEQQIERAGWLDPGFYAHPDHIASLRYVLERSRRSSVAIVVLLPEAKFARERLTPLAEDAARRVLSEFMSTGLRVVDKRAALPDESFEALFHALPEARRTFSRDLAQDIRPFLSGSAR